jgi:hypothetical protein
MEKYVYNKLADQSWFTDRLVDGWLGVKANVGG